MSTHNTFGWEIRKLTLCLLSIFSCFFVVCWFKKKSTFSKNSFRNTIRVSNSLNLYQARRFVGPEMGPNCLQMLSAEGTGLVGKELIFNYSLLSFTIDSPPPPPQNASKIKKKSVTDFFLVCCNWIMLYTKCNSKYVDFMKPVWTGFQLMLTWRGQFQVNL